jgi:hypothetical protein
LTLLPCKGARLDRWLPLNDIKAISDDCDYDAKVYGGTRCTSLEIYY